LLSNPELVEAHLPLVAFFGQQRASFDPWWWPMNSGAKLEDYGLDPLAHEALCGSLRLQPPETRMIGCRGSISAVRGCAAIITTRPSSGYIPCLESLQCRAFEPLAMIRISDLNQRASPFAQRVTIQISHSKLSDGIVNGGVVDGPIGSTAA